MKRWALFDAMTNAHRLHQPAVPQHSAACGCRPASSDLAGACSGSLQVSVRDRRLSNSFHPQAFHRAVTLK